MTNNNKYDTISYFPPNSLDSLDSLNLLDSYGGNTGISIEPICLKRNGVVVHQPEKNKLINYNDSRYLHAIRNAAASSDRIDNFIDLWENEPSDLKNHEDFAPNFFRTNFEFQRSIMSSMLIWGKPTNGLQPQCGFRPTRATLIY